MSGKSGSGLGGAVLVVGLLVAGVFGSKSPRHEAPPVTPAVQPAAAPAAPEPAPAPTVAPGRALKTAKALAAHGLRVPSERAAAYALSLYVLAQIPAGTAEAADAAALRKEIVARQNLPAAKRNAPPSQAQLEGLVARIRKDPATGAVSVAPSLALASGTSVSAAPAPAQPAQPTPRGGASPGCAENGSCYGDISSNTGRPKTTYVNGYYRRDGTYVRGHYRSRPR